MKAFRSQLHYAAHVNRAGGRSVVFGTLYPARSTRLRAYAPHRMLYLVLIVLVVVVLVGFWILNTLRKKGQEPPA